MEVTQRGDAATKNYLAPAEPNVYRSVLLAQTRAPAERNVHISLRWSEEENVAGGVL